MKRDYAGEFRRPKIAPTSPQARRVQSRNPGGSERRFVHHRLSVILFSLGLKNREEPTT